MSNFVTLLKTNLRETLDTRKFKENKKSSISFLSFIILMGILFVGLSTLYSYILCNMIKQAEGPYIVGFFMMSGVATIFVLMTSIQKVKGIFTGNDYDVLRAMPIKKTTIVLVKIVSLYFSELLYSLVILVPNAIVTFIFSNDIRFLIYGLMSSILAPAVPLSVAAIFALFISLIADRFKFGNVLTMIFYLVYCVLIFFLSFSISSSSSEPGNISNVITMSNVMKWINPATVLIELGFDNILYIVLYAVGNVVLILLVSAFIAIFFDIIHALISNFKSRNEYKRKDLKVSGQFKTLFKMDASKLFKSKMYIINALISGIMAILGTTVMCIQVKEVPNKDQVSIIAIVVLCLILSIMTPASCAINMDGSNFYIMKSLPISRNKYLLSKGTLSSLIEVVFAVIASTIIVLFVKPSPILIVGAYLIPAIYVTFISFFDLIINVLKPKLDWKNEQEAIKQSSCVVVSMLLVFLIDIVIGACLVLLFIFVNSYVSILSTIGLVLLISVIMITITVKKADYFIDRIE